MTITENKEEAVKQLSNTRHKAAMLMTRLMLAKEQQSADKVKDRIAKLDTRIKGLLQDMMQSWKSRADEKNQEISALNKKIQKSIAAVQDKKKRAAEVVKALGLLDDVIDIAAKYI
jgi:septal ring factor EnvC (AmiA/AmiB activator)